MTFISDWKHWLKAKQTPATSWADQRRNEALELIASAEQNGTWAELCRNSNGFVREVAVRRLCDSPSPEALQELVERLNDWVPQVRDVAATGVQTYLTTAHVEALLFALDAFIALEVRQRANHGATLAQVRAVLQSADVREAVHACFIARHGRTARFLFAVLLGADASPEQLLRDALVHRDLTVRVAAVGACAQLSPDQACVLLEQALRQSAARVRLGALQALLPLAQDPLPALRQALLDASPAVRSLARWHAPRHGLEASAVLAEQLQQAMPTSKRHWLAVLGLAAELDVELPEAWWKAALHCGYSSVRLAAVSLPGERPLADLLEALEDPSDKVFAALIARLDKLPWATTNMQVGVFLRTQWPQMGAPRAHQVLALLPAWQQVAYLLERQDGEAGVQAHWLEEIAQWCQRQYRIVDPVTSKEQRAALIARLEDLARQGLIDRHGIARLV